MPHGVFTDISISQYPIGESRPNLIELAMTDNISKYEADSGLGDKQNIETVERAPQYSQANHLDRARAMTPAHRVEVEKSLKRKLDARCSLFVLIYVSKVMR